MSGCRTVEISVWYWLERLRKTRISPVTLSAAAFPDSLPPQYPSYFSRCWLVHRRSHAALALGAAHPYTWPSARGSCSLHFGALPWLLFVISSRHSFGKVCTPIPVHVPYSIIMYQWSTFWKENVYHWYMMMEWGTWTGMGAPTLFNNLGF